MCNKLPFPHCSYFQLYELNEVYDVYPIVRGREREKWEKQKWWQKGSFMETETYVWIFDCILKNV